jgi:hypothetical protein
LCASVGSSCLLHCFLLLSHSSQLWGQGVAGDWPGGTEPKTLEMTLNNPFLAWVGKQRLRDGKGLSHAFLEIHIKRSHPVCSLVAPRLVLYSPEQVLCPGAHAHSLVTVCTHS